MLHHKDFVAHNALLQEAREREQIRRAWTAIPTVKLPVRRVRRGLGAHILRIIKRVKP